VLQISKFRVLTISIFLGFVATLISRSLIPPSSEYIAGAIQEKHESPVAVVDQNSEVGQSFQVQEGSFDSLAFYVLSVDQQAGPVIFSLYLMGRDDPLLTKELLPTEMRSMAVYTVRFNPIETTAVHDYRFTLRVMSESSGEVLVLGGTTWDSYAGGNIVGVDNTSGDLAFAIYSTPSIFEVARRGFATLNAYAKPLLVLTLLLLFCALIVWRIIYHPQTDSLLLLTIAIGCSPLLVVILWLVVNIFKISFEPIILFLCSALIWIPLHRSQIALPIKLLNLYRVVTILIVSCFVISVQFSFISNVFFPSYVDSVHHVLLSDFIANTRMSSLDLDVFDAGDGVFLYHTGLHAVAASISILSGQTLSASQTLLVLGPVLLWLFSLSLYSLVSVIGCNHWVALLSMILATFAFQMPTYLLNWGKYPLLFALSTFGSLLALLLIAFRNKQLNWLSRFAVGLLLSSSILIHTRVMFVWVVIGAAFFLIKVWDTKLRELFTLAIPYMLPFAFVVGLWFFPNWQNWKQAQSTTQITAIEAPALEIQGVYSFIPVEYFWVVILILGFIVPVTKRLKEKMFVALSVLGLMVIPLFPSNLVPGGGFLDPQFTAAFVILPIVVGLALVFQGINEKMQQPQWLLPFVVAAITVGGLTGRGSFPSTCCQIASLDDFTTLDWIEQNIRPSALWGIAVTQWTNGQVVGVDGGYWLNISHQQQATLPSLLYGFSDATTQERITKQALEVDSVIRNEGDICGLNIDYIYMGSRPNSFGRHLLEDNPNLQVIYEHGSGAVFEVRGC
jgi:hypothetical protein